MSTRKPPRLHSEHAAAPSAGEPQTYKVGYRRPPRHTQFRPGRSGNPRGAPKRVKTLAMHLTDILNERVTIREGNKSKRISKGEALARAVVAMAFKLDPKAMRLLFGLPSGALDSDRGNDDGATSIADYQAVIDSFLQRNGGGDGNAGTKPANRKRGKR